MTVHFDLSEEDWAAMQMQYAKNTGQFRKAQTSIGAMAAILAALSLFVLLFDHRSFMGGAFLTYAFILAGLAASLPQISRRNVIKLLRRGHHKALFGASSVTLTPKGIQSTNPISESLLFWSAVEKLVESETHFFVQFSAGVNLIIPKRVFATQSQGIEFLRMAEQYRQSATGTPIPTTQRGAWWTQGSQVVETQSQRQ